MKHNKTLIKVGLLFFALVLTINHLHMIHIPEFFLGLGEGLALSFLLIGAFYHSPVMVRIRDFKRRILKG